MSSRSRVRRPAANGVFGFGRYNVCVTDSIRIAERDDLMSLDMNEIESESYRLVINGILDLLRSLRRAVPQWREVAERELGRAITEARALEGTIPGDILDDFGDEFRLIELTERDLFSSLSVQFASAVENSLGSICRHRGLGLPPRPNWGHKRNAVEALLGRGLDTLPGFDQATRARLLANCAKHNAGRTSAEFVAQYGGALEAEIVYERENWDAIIEGIDSVLHNIVAALPPRTP